MGEHGPGTLLAAGARMFAVAGAALIAVVAALAATVGPASGSETAASQPVAYCALPTFHGTVAWGFHASVPIKAATGSYAHGRGSLAGQAASGEICQVNRVAGAPDRQVILSVTHGAVTPVHGAVVGGVTGNLMRLPVRVSSSTDAQCKRGTRGTVTLFASYNGVRSDSVKLRFGRACSRHDHLYSGSGVVALVPR